ncbi:MAG TPA: hypothetical protein V6D29_03990 [Leptolyngbyaceae cyanobacterium]
MYLFIDQLKKTQWVFKRLIGGFFGALNLGAVVLSIQIVKTHLFSSLLSWLENWLTSPLPINGFGFIKVIIGFLVWVIGLCLSLIESLISFVTHGLVNIPLGHWVSLLQSVISNLIAPQWATIAVVKPADLIPLSSQLLQLIQNSDAIAAVIIAVLFTAILTWVTTWLMDVDVPTALAKATNEFKAKRATKLMNELRKALLEVDFYNLPANLDNQRLRQVAEFMSIKTPLFSQYDVPNLNPA